MNYAIIMAAGRGKRMKANINKQFIPIKDKPVLAYTIDKFEKSPCIDEILLVAAEDEIEICKNEIVYKYNFKKVKKIVPGGNERQESVFNGLKALEAKDDDIVLIHDGARPFVEDRIINEGVLYARKYGAAACGITPRDTIKVKGAKGFSEGTLERNKLFCVQTPQCFKYKLIVEAHLVAENNKVFATDDTALCEKQGNKVYLYEGSYENFKITTPEDIYSAERIIEKTKDIDTKYHDMYNI